jgi:integrase
MKEAKAFVESGKARGQQSLRHSNVRTVPEAIQLWLDICEKEGRNGQEPVSPSTLENYRWRARTMADFQWDRDLTQLEEPDIVAFRSWLKRTCMPDQAKKVLSSFHSVLLEMQVRGIIADDPAKHVTIKHNPRNKEPVIIPTIQEMRTLLDTADRLANSKNAELARAWERYRPMVYLAVDTGMRPQEYLVLPTRALERKGLNIVQALDRSNRIGPPKTRAGRRYIPVSADVMDMIQNYIEKNGTNEFVFPTRREGGYQRYNVFVRRGFHKLIEEAGFADEFEQDGRRKIVRKFTPYSLRHFFASMLIHQNTSLKYIQSVMGHENIKMTFDVYGHIIRQKETDDIGKSGGIIKFVC